MSWRQTSFILMYHSHDATNTSSTDSHTDCITLTKLLSIPIGKLDAMLMLRNLFTAWRLTVLEYGPWFSWSALQMSTKQTNITQSCIRTCFLRLMTPQYTARIALLKCSMLNVWSKINYLFPFLFHGNTRLLVLKNQVSHSERWHKVSHFNDTVNNSHAQNLSLKATGHVYETLRLQCLKS